MAPQTVDDLCDLAAAVEPAEARVLAAVADRLGLMADLAGGDLTLFAHSREADRLILLAEGRPTVCRPLYSKPRAGELLNSETEPLVARCLSSGRLRRSRYACLVGGRPVEQVVLPVRRGGRPVAALSVERALAHGPWGPRQKALRQAANALSRSLLGSAVQPRDLLCVIRMARGIAVAEPSGDILYADGEARQLWRKVQPESQYVPRLPPTTPPGATLISHREEPWGREWEFQVAETVLRRRDLPFEPEAEGSNILTTIHDVSHLHAAQWRVSSRSAAVQEIHHRIKNNLQTISSLLRMQSRRETSPQAQESLRTAIGRVQSVAFVHEALSRDGADEVDLKALAADLVEAALHGAQREGGDLSYAVLGPRLLLPAARASQVALLLNELIQNAIKHAFPPQRGGSITIQFENGPEGTTISVCDDGVGLPDGFDLLRTKTLGLQITRRIVESDLGGALQVASEGGTRITISLPSALVHEETEHR